MSPLRPMIRLYLSHRFLEDDVFELEHTNLALTDRIAGLKNPEAGAMVSFEGWVRKTNEGKEVSRLEYEGFEPLACKEGVRIVEEALQKFDILDAFCVHRLGSLDIGEMAVWVGVSAGHRDGAFGACRYVIDETKQRVPIWKKEFYVGGDTGWINSEPPRET